MVQAMALLWREAHSNQICSWSVITTSSTLWRLISAALSLNSASWRLWCNPRILAASSNIPLLISGFEFIISEIKKTVNPTKKIIKKEEPKKNK